MTNDLLYEDGPKPGEFVGPREPIWDEMLRGPFGLQYYANLISRIDPLRAENLLRHSSLIDTGNGTLKFNCWLPYGAT